MIYDDIFGIWIDNNTNDIQEFENLNEDLPFEILTWKTTSLSTTSDFLDLTISVDDNHNINTKTYQK